MKVRLLSMLLALILAVSLSVVACGGTPDFELSNLILSKSSLKVNEQLTITVTVENIGTAEGTHTVNFSVDGEEFTRTVTLDANKKGTVDIAYTPTAAKTYAVTVEGPNELTASFVANPLEVCIVGTPAGEDSEWWWFDYDVTGGKIDCYYSTANAAKDLMHMDYFPETSMRIYFSKEVTDNNSRQVKIDGESFTSEFFETQFMGAKTKIWLYLGEYSGGKLNHMDAEGTLYLVDDATDADVDVIDEQGKEREFEFSGDSVAGDVVGDFPLYAYAEALGALKIRINLPTMMTTGHIYNKAIKKDPAGAGIDGSEVEATGLHFCHGGDDGAVAPYVGTQGTLVVAATATDMKYASFDVDFQMLLVMEIEPK